MFPHLHPGMKRFAAPHGPQRPEYVHLALAQLRAGKLCLLDSVAGGGTVFGRLKEDGIRMREIWHGSAVSQACAAPPLPPALASPTVFSYQELKPGRRLEVSKRDAACYFDQLRLPDQLTKYMGRPRIWRSELLEAGCTPQELQSMLAESGASDAEAWYPASKVWGMGFSWSSAVGQQVLLSICERSGLDRHRVLAPTEPIPESLDLQYAVATDDVMIFSDVPGRTVTAARRLDQEMAAGGIQRKVEKDINGAHNCRCIGVDLVGGQAWCAPASRTWAVLCELVQLMERPRASPRAVASFLGRVQWYDLLARAKLACYQKVYHFTRLRPETGAREVDRDVVCELIRSAALLPWWRVELTRPFSNTVLATDASTDFGYGGSVATMPIAEVRAMSRLCSQAGEGVTLADSPPAPTQQQKRRLRLGARREAFTTVFAIRARQRAHINILEAEALNLGLSWWLRRGDRHAKRVVILLDSRVAIGGAAKGRSSSAPLLRCFRRTAALTLAGRLQPYYVYIPSADNPADAPSRGRLRRTQAPKLLQKLRRARQRTEAAIRRLQA
jgi:hypothetical protein